MRNILDSFGCVKGTEARTYRLQWDGRAIVLVLVPGACVEALGRGIEYAGPVSRRAAALWMKGARREGEIEREAAGQLALPLGR